LVQKKIDVSNLSETEGGLGRQLPSNYSLVFVLFAINSNNREHYRMTTNKTFFQHSGVWFLQKCSHVTQLRLCRLFKSRVLYKD